MKTDCLINEELKQACARKGLRLTKQRTEILKAVKSSCSHPDVLAVHSVVKDKIKGISVDTVYRTLQTFEDLGLIFRVDNQIPRARFDGDLCAHSHFICVKCGAVFDIFSDAEVMAPENVSDFGEVRRVNLQIKGVCNKCKTNKKRKGD